MDFKTILAAFRAKFPQIHQSRLPERGVSLQEPCPKCDRMMLVCVHRDVGTVDSTDIFEHICLAPDCDYWVSDRQHVGFGQESSGDELCSFCGRDVFAPRCAKCDSARVQLSEYSWRIPVRTKFWCCRDCGFIADEDTPTVERLPKCPQCESSLRYQVVNIDDTDSSVPGEGKPVWGLRCRTCSFQAEEKGVIRRAYLGGPDRPLRGGCDEDQRRDNMVYPTEAAPPPQEGEDKGKAANEQERTSLLKLGLKLGVEVLRCLCARICSALQRR